MSARSALKSPAAPKPFPRSSAAEALAEAFAQALGRPSGRSGLAEPEAAFILQAQEDYAADELPEMSVADLAANFADFWAFAARQTGSGPAIRVVSAVGADGRRRPRARIE